MRNFLAIFSDNRFSLFIQQSPNLCTRAFTLLSNPLFHRFSRSIDHSFSLSDYRKLILSTFHVSNTKTASGSRPSRVPSPSHCSRGAHVQPVVPDLLAVRALRTLHEAPTFSQWVPAFSRSVPFALFTRGPRSASGSRPSRGPCPSHCSRGAHVQPVGPGLLAVRALRTLHEAPTFSQWVPAFSRSVPFALFTRGPRSASGSRPSRGPCPSHCSRGAHVQPVGPGLLAVRALRTLHEAHTFSQWVPAFSRSVPFALFTRRPRSASGSRPCRGPCPSHCSRGAHVQPVGCGFVAFRTFCTVHEAPRPSRGPCPSHCSRGAHVQPVGRGLLAVRALRTLHEAPTFSQWVPALSRSVPFALFTRRPRSASGSRPCRVPYLLHCSRGAHVQPVGPGILAFPIGADQIV